MILNSRSYPFATEFRAAMAQRCATFPRIAHAGEGLKRAAPLAEDAGVIIVTEGLNSIQTPGFFLDTSKLGFEIGWVPRGVRGGEGIKLADFQNLRGLVDQILGR